MIQRRVRSIAAVVFCAVMGLGCRHRSPAGGAAPGEAAPAKSAAVNKPATTQAMPAATAPASGGSFTKPTAGVSLDYPAGWQPRPSDDYELLLIPADGANDRSISLDVPDLPPHLPGMIPIGLVKKGYLDDLKKKASSFQTREESPTMIGATARLVISTWKDGDKTMCDRALILIHQDRVYILRAACDAAHEAAMREMFDGIVKTLRWTK